MQIMFQSIITKPKYLKDHCYNAALCSCLDEEMSLYRPAVIALAAIETSTPGRDTLSALFNSPVIRESSFHEVSG